MESKEIKELLVEIRDELKKTNKRLDWFENTAKEEMAKENENPIHPHKNWKSYIPITIVLIALFSLIYYSKQ